MHDVVTGQLDSRGRMINSGRFPTRDPWEYIDGTNLYQLAQSNPIRYRDPTGFASEEDPHWGFPNPGGRGTDPDPIYEKLMMEEWHRLAMYYRDCATGARTNCKNTGAISYNDMYEYCMGMYRDRKKRYNKIKDGGGGKWLSDYHGNRVTCKECNGEGHEAAKLLCERRIAAQVLVYGSKNTKASIQAVIGSVATITGGGLTRYGSKSGNFIATGVGLSLTAGGLIAVYTSDADILNGAVNIGNKSREAVQRYCNCDNIMP
jgi:hypothetical protein